MPWEIWPKKDVVGCDKLRGGVKHPLIRRFPNGETYPIEDRMIGSRPSSINLKTGFIKEKTVQIS